MKNKKNVGWKKEGNKSAQVTVFIILAIMIAVVLIILFRNKPGINFITKSESPVEKIQNCIKSSAKEGLALLSNQGGIINPKNYYLYEGDKVGYLCYTEQYYQPCVMQKPLLKQDIEKDLKDYIDPKISDCIEAERNSLESQGYSVDYKKPESTVKLAPGNIIIDTNINLRVSKDNTASYRSIKTDISSRIYEFAMTAGSISNWEARYGDSESMAYMLYYPTLKVEKKIQSEGTRIYILTDRNSGEKFTFAIRSVALPSGVTGK